MPLRIENEPSIYGTKGVSSSSNVIVPLMQLNPARVKEEALEVLLTCEKFLADFESVDQRSEDALDGAEHAAQAQVDQHEEEHDGPEGRGREVGHGLREGDEGQACALDRLLSGRRRRRGWIPAAWGVLI